MEINELLLNCGVNPKRKGFRYLHDAISHRMCDSEIKLIHGIFVRVGMRYNTNFHAVERTCRLALRKASEDFGTEAAAFYLGQPPRAQHYTCSDFISLAAMACARQQRKPPRAV